MRFLDRKDRMKMKKRVISKKMKTKRKKMNEMHFSMKLRKHLKDATKTSLQFQVLLWK
jgi:hypothetical protein